MSVIYVLGAIVAAVLILIVLASRRPDEFRIERSARIETRPEDVFDEINDFRNWKQWSPWEELDPNMVTTYDGPESGVGAKKAWTGNSKAGQGAMEILDTDMPNRVKIRIDFIKPIQAQHISEFHMKPEGSATLISWQMHGKNNLISKVFGLFMNMDAMIGKDFEEGFENLKTVLKNKA